MHIAPKERKSVLILIGVFLGFFILFGSLAKDYVISPNDASRLAMVYAQMVEQIIKEHWRYPMVGGRETRTAQVEIHMDQDGLILDSVLTASSGRPDFDASALKAVAEAKELPAPPTEELRVIRINFNLQELGN